jgi:hypothetical protein
MAKVKSNRESWRNQYKLTRGPGREIEHLLMFLSVHFPLILKVNLIRKPLDIPEITRMLRTYSVKGNVWLGLFYYV